MSNVFPDGVVADPPRLSSRNRTFSTLNYGDSALVTGKVFIEKSVEEPVLRMRRNAKTNIPILEMHVAEVKSVFRRLLDWEDVYFEDLTEVKRRIKIEGAGKYKFPHISLSLNGITTRPGDVNGRAMANGGVTSYTDSKVQPIAREHRFIPADFAFKVAYFYDDYPTAVQVSLDLGFLAGMRLLRYNVMLENFEHDVSLMFDPGISIGSIDHQPEDGPIGSVEFTFTLSSGISDVDKRPIIEDAGNKRGRGLVTHMDIGGDRSTDELTEPYLTPEEAFAKIRQEAADEP